MNMKNNRQLEIFPWKSRFLYVKIETTQTKIDPKEDDNCQPSIQLQNPTHSAEHELGTTQPQLVVKLPVQAKTGV